MTCPKPGWWSIWSQKIITRHKYRSDLWTKGRVGGRSRRPAFMWYLTDWEDAKGTSTVPVLLTGKSINCGTSMSLHATAGSRQCSQITYTTLHNGHVPPVGNKIQGGCNPHAHHTAAQAPPTPPNRTETRHESSICSACVAFTCRETNRSAQIQQIAVWQRRDFCFVAMHFGSKQHFQNTLPLVCYLVEMENGSFSLPFRSFHHGPGHKTSFVARQHGPVVILVRHADAGRRQIQVTDQKCPF